MTAMTRLSAAFRSQLEAAPWLRWALPVIVLLALVTLGQGLETLRKNTQQLAIDREIELRRIQALQGEDAWFSRAAQATELRDRLQAELPAVATGGLAQAALQSWLRDTALAGLAEDTVRINIVSSSTIDALPGILRVQVSLNGALGGRQALGVLRQIEGADNLVVVETLMIRSDHNPMFTATLNAYYRLPSTGSAQ